EDRAFDSSRHILRTRERAIEQHRDIARGFRFQMTQSRSGSLPQRSGIEFFGLAASHQKQPSGLQPGGFVQQNPVQDFASELLRFVQFLDESAEGQALLSLKTDRYQGIAFQGLDGLNV